MQAKGKLGNERVRLAILLAVLAVVAVVAAVRLLGGGGIGGGASRSDELVYEARNLKVLETAAIGRRDDRPVESGGRRRRRQYRAPRCHLARRRRRAS
jgi:hypothetical protein